MTPSPRIVALMQPYLFPYLGYFALVDYADVFVLFDNVQYHRRGWMHRNRVLHPAKGWVHWGVPVVKAPRSAPISAIELAPGWRSRLLEALDSAYSGRAPYFAETFAWVASVLSADTRRLATLNRQTLSATAERLGLDQDWRSASALDLVRAPGAPVSSWAIQACHKVDGSAYLNPPGGAHLYPPDHFRSAGLGLGVLQPVLVEYPRGRQPWQAGLSVVDALMFQTPEEVRAQVRASRVDWVVDPPERGGAG